MFESNNIIQRGELQIMVIPAPDTAPSPYPNPNPETSGSSDSDPIYIKYSRLPEIGTQRADLLPARLIPDVDATADDVVVRSA